MSTSVLSWKVGLQGIVSTGDFVNPMYNLPATAYCHHVQVSALHLESSKWVPYLQQMFPVSPQGEVGGNCDMIVLCMGVISFGLSAAHGQVCLCPWSKPSFIALPYIS